MAKRPPVDPNRVAVLEDICEELVEKLTAADAVFTVDGTPMVTVKYEDGNFKKKTLLAGWNFMVRYAYVATKGQIIIGMEPEDEQEYKSIEVDLKDCDNYFPLMGGEVAKVLGTEGENLVSVIESIFQPRLAELSKPREEKLKALEDAYSDNVNFGRF